MSVEEYLESEKLSDVKREYVGGVVYAMAGASVRHDTLVANIVGSLVGSLRGKRCRAFTPDMKIRLKFPTHFRFYYPDATVVCDRDPPSEEAFIDNPVVVFEVLSRSTRRLDQGEKMDAYLSMHSLSVYALVEQEVPLITLHRRTDQGFVRETCEGLGSALALPEVGLDLPLSHIYDRVEFFPEPDDET